MVARAHVLAAGAFVAAWPRPAAPAETQRSVRVEYHVPAECPSLDRFLELVRARARRFRGDERGTVVRVDVNQQEGGYHGVIAFERAGERASRQVEGSSCSEVADALALIAAISLHQDPTQRATAPPAAHPSRPPPSPVAPEPSRWVIGTTLGASARGGFAPWPAWQGDIGVELRSWRRTRSFVPALRANVLFASRTNFAAADGTASFRLSGGRLETCPVALTLAPAMFLEPWVGLEAGGERVLGRTPLGQRVRWTGWAAAQVSLRLRIAVANGVSVNVLGEAGLPLTRHGYYLADPARHSFQTPPVFFRAGVEAVIHFL